MNKLLITFFALCVIAVYAAAPVVKRETDPKKEQNYLNDIQENFSKFAKEAQDSLSKALNPEDIKQKLQEFTNTVSKAIDDIKVKSEPKA